MTMLDLRQQWKHLYAPSANKVVLVDVPELKSLMIDGRTAPGQAPGIILVQDWIFGQRGTMAAVSLFPGGSAILAPESLDWDAEGFTARILSPLRDAVTAARPGPVRDDLDLLIGRN